MTEKILQGLTCSNCGGAVPIPEGQAVVACPFCEMRSLVKGDNGIRRYQVPRAIDRTQALDAAKNFLSGKIQIARNAVSTSKIIEAFVAYLPFWARWSRVLGWIFGKEKVGSGDNQRYEPRELKIAEDMDWTGVALDVGEFGVEKISLHNRSLEPFNAEELHRVGMVFEPVSSSTEAVDEAEANIKARVRKMADLDGVSQTFIRFVHKRLGLVYYPLWVVRYLYKGRSFQIVIDGHSGEVLYGKAPGSTFFRSLALVGGMAVGAFVAIDVGSVIAYVSLFSGDEDGLGGLAIAGAVFMTGIGIMIWGYRSFRYGEHYEYHGHRKERRRIRTRKERGVRRIVEEDK